MNVSYERSLSWEVTSWSVCNIGPSAFMEPDGSLPYSQQRASGLANGIQSIVKQPFTLGYILLSLSFPNVLISSDYPTKNLYACFISPPSPFLWATCLQFYSSRFDHFLVKSASYGALTFNFLSFLSLTFKYPSQHPHSCSSLRLRDQVYHPYTTTGTIIVVYVFIYMYLDRRR
jgi:hypothetical protein